MAGLGSATQRSLDSERIRLSLLVRVAGNAGQFSPKLATAVAGASDEEVQVMSDLLENGLSIPELISVLKGAHVVVGDDSLYERWIFPSSHKRISSHHRSVDKLATPDYGLDGPLVRESLHGKAPMGTWVQLERTSAQFRWGALPTVADLIHLRDYLIYRFTGMNVGPWGLSTLVDTRPMVLRPANQTGGRAAERGLAALTPQRWSGAGTGATGAGTGAAADGPAADGPAADWVGLFTADVPAIGPAGDLFDPPEAVRPRDLLPDAPFKEELGPGLFGSLQLTRQDVVLRPAVARIVDAEPPGFGTWPTPGEPENRTLSLGRSTLRVRAAVQVVRTRPVFAGMEENPT